MSFANAYADSRRAEAYSRLTLPGTYYLAFRDLPAILARHAPGVAAIDFGCGAGRSTRFLRSHGFDPVGVDISAHMIACAQAIDPDGCYLHMRDGDFSSLPRAAFDVVLSAFTFDNIPGADHRVRLLSGLRARLNPRGVLILLGSTPEMYTHDWASFTTSHFPENAAARSGDVVKVIITDVEDGRHVDDILWLDEDYRDAFHAAGLRILETHRPLATGEEPYAWINEMRVPPWVIYVLGRAERPTRGDGRRP